MSESQLQTEQITDSPSNGRVVLRYEQVPETSYERMYALSLSSKKRADHYPVVDWADLITLDLSLFDACGGKQKLADQLFKAINEIGFFVCQPLLSTSLV